MRGINTGNFTNYSTLKKQEEIILKISAASGRDFPDMISPAQEKIAGKQFLAHLVRPKGEGPGMDTHQTRATATEGEMTLSHSETPSSLFFGRRLPKPLPLKEKTAFEKKSRLSFIAAIQEVLINIIKKNEFPALVELYMRYQNDESKKQALATLDEILLAPELILFWGNILGKRTGSRPFSPSHPLKRHRLKNQPPEKPDAIHIFHLLIGSFYARSSTSRHFALLAFTALFEEFHAENSSRATNIFHHYWKEFTPYTPIDLECKKIINEQIKRFSNPEHCSDAFSIIEEQVGLLRKEQEREIEFGIQYHSPYAYNLFIRNSEEILRMARYMGEIIHPHYLKILYEMEERLEPMEKIYGAAGFYILSGAYYDIGRLLDIIARQLRNKLPKKTPAPPYQVCGIQSKRRSVSTVELQIQAIAHNYEESAKVYYEKALAKINAAIILNKGDEYDNLLFNVCQGNTEIDDIIKSENQKTQNESVVEHYIEDTDLTRLEVSRNYLVRNLKFYHPKLSLEKTSKMSLQMFIDFNKQQLETQSLTIAKPIHYSQQEAYYFNTLLTSTDDITIQRILNELGKRFNELTKNKPLTFFTKSHDSFPDEDHGTEYYQKLAEFIFQLTSVQQWKGSQEIKLFISESGRERIISFSTVQNFIMNEFLFSAEDIAYVAREKCRTITYTNGGNTITTRLSIDDIAKTKGEFPPEQLSKHFDSVRYIYDRLFFLIAALKNPNFAEQIPFEIQKNVLRLRDILSQHFSYVLSNPPSITEGFLIKEELPNPYRKIIDKRSATDTSPVPLLLGTRLKLPNECMAIIFSFFNPLQLLMFSTVCKQFWRFSMEESFWKHWYDLLALLLNNSTISSTKKYINPIDPPSFENAATTFTRRKKVVIRKFYEATEVFGNRFGLMLFQRPKDPVTILNRLLNTYDKEILRKEDLVFLANELCDLLLFNPNAIPTSFTYDGKETSTRQTMINIAKCLIDPENAWLYIPPKEIYHFCCQESATLSKSVERSHPWLFQPLRGTFGSVTLEEKKEATQVSLT